MYVTGCTKLRRYFCIYEALRENVARLGVQSLFSCVTLILRLAIVCALVGYEVVKLLRNYLHSH